jgi:hypothetical protein
MSDQKFYTKLKKDGEFDEPGEYFIESGIISNGPNGRNIEELGIIAFHKDKNQCLIKAADAMIREGIRLYGMVK